MEVRRRTQGTRDRLGPIAPGIQYDSQPVGEFIQLVPYRLELITPGKRIDQAHKRLDDAPISKLPIDLPEHRGKQALLDMQLRILGRTQTSLVQMSQYVRSQANQGVRRDGRQASLQQVVHLTLEGIIRRGNLQARNGPS
jgi:hypothetical protein